MFELVSAKNSIISELRRLAQRRSSRIEQGRFLIEGANLLAVALDAAIPIELVLSDGAATLDDQTLAIARQARDLGARLIELPEGVMARVADTVSPQPIISVVARQTVSLASIVEQASSLLPIVVLVGIGDPGNAGTLLRSAEAAGASAVVFCDGSVDAFNPKTVRASAGAIFQVPIVDSMNAEAVVAQLTESGIRTVGLVVRSGAPLDDTTLSGPVAIVLGSEPHGLADDLSVTLDELVTIEMSGRSESLNVAMAGTLVVFEAARQRRGGNCLDTTTPSGKARP